nr:chymotrypsin inhibitor-like [Megalopta genalis]
MFRLHFGFLLLAVLAVFAAGSIQEQCDENEEFTSCGIACPPTCGKPEPRSCTKNCVIGCQCKAGYLRNSAGACVTSQEC